MSPAETAWAEFWTNKPNPPEHAAYMKRAAELYPDLPPGAQQNALFCLEAHGKNAARRYVTNARARKADAERNIMGETLSTHRSRLAAAVKRWQSSHVITPKRRREYLAMAARWQAYMAGAMRPSIVGADFA